MSLFQAHMLAYGEPDEMRSIEVPDAKLTGTEDDLNFIYHYGQNDFQPRDNPSLSVGDVVEFDNRYFMVAFCGFKEMTTEQFTEYRNTDSHNRQKWCRRFDTKYRM